MAISQTPLFGRAWELLVALPPNDAGEQSTVTVSCNAWDPETLRMVFEVNLTAFSTKNAYWYAKIDIYNLNPTLAAQLIDSQGASVTLKAGYQTGSGQYNTIFQGEVYQAMFERVEVVDSKITLMVYTGLTQSIANPVSLRGRRNMSQMELIQTMCAAANTPIPIGAIDPTAETALSQTQLPRARPIFGDPFDFIDDVASGNNMISWYGFDGIGISRVGAANAVPEITYDGGSGQIIGTPQQTLDGITMNVLLDPNVRVAAPPQAIQIVNSQIRQLGYTLPGYAPALNPDGTYLVIGIQHNGDTRGEDWKTEIVALYSGGAQFAAIMAANSPPASGTQAINDPRSPR